MKKMILLCSFVSFLAAPLLAQDSPVFVLGEQEKKYEQLTRDYSQSLLTACDNDMQVAFDKWLEMMQAMEAYAKKIRFDLNGVSVWFHVFWSPEGNIDNVGFLLRPNSRNIPNADLAAFLSSFIKRYQFPVTSDQPFSHYTGATFPTFSQRVGDE